MTTFTQFIIGFSVISACIFFIVYVAFLKNLNKSWAAVAACFVLLLGLSCLQIVHFEYLLAGGEPLATVYYRLLIFIVPSSFYLFSRSILFPNHQLNVKDFVHLVPWLFAFVVEKQLAAILAFLIGSLYCCWILSIVYKLRAHHKRFGVELFFFGFFAITAVLVLLMGVSTSFIDSRYFYLFYANGIGVAFVLITACFMIWPNLLAELSEVVTLSYANSTLKNVDTVACLQKLAELMDEKIYQNENLNLAIVAEEMSLTSHQLSELINTQFGQNFSKYIRAQRVEEAKRLLKMHPKASVLSIGMEVGFKSQSNFYTAFSEITGQSPGQFRGI